MANGHDSGKKQFGQSETPRRRSHASYGDYFSRTSPDTCVNNLLTDTSTNNGDLHVDDMKDTLC